MISTGCHLAEVLLTFQSFGATFAAAVATGRDSATSDPWVYPRLSNFEIE